MKYKPGLHILAEIYTDQDTLLRDFVPVRALFMDKIQQYGLTSVGEVFHSFPGAGFTGVICLTESHIAIHSWPEYGLATFDIYLSNFKKENDAVTRALFEDTLALFKASRHTKQEVKR
jgi:S-adenosylmethionine decarboxylase